jgi:hypothetical protein
MTIASSEVVEVNFASVLHFLLEEKAAQVDLTAKR